MLSQGCLRANSVRRWTKLPAFRKYGSYPDSKKDSPLTQSQASVPAPNTIPPPKIHRVTYEYPPPPNPNSDPPPESSAWRRHVPLFIGVGGLLWAGYAVYYFFGESKSQEQDLLNPQTFSEFRITYKQPVNEDTVLIELAPKYVASTALLKSGATIWNGKRIWSIQIKHPMIQIARNYTPLPLYFMQSERPNEPSLLRMMGAASDEGRMCLLVKRYADGEMSRYLHSLPVGSDVEVRGPFIEHKFPYEKADSQKLRQPMLDLPSRMSPEAELDPHSGIDKASNIVMFTAGTGLSTAMQPLLSPHNPPRGFTHVFYSARSRSDIPFERFMLFLESAGRAKFHTYIDDENRFINLEDIPRPTTTPATTALNATAQGERALEDASTVVPRKYASVVQQFGDKNNQDAYLPGVSRAVICGPPGYVAYLSGNPGIDGEAPIGGLLGQRGWTSKNTKRLLDI